MIKVWHSFVVKKW